MWGLSRGIWRKMQSLIIENITLDCFTLDANFSRNAKIRIRNRNFCNVKLSVEPNTSAAFKPAVWVAILFRFHPSIVSVVCLGLLSEAIMKNVPLLHTLYSHTRDPMSSPQVKNNFCIPGNPKLSLSAYRLALRGLDNKYYFFLYYPHGEKQFFISIPKRQAYSKN